MLNRVLIAIGSSLIVYGLSSTVFAQSLQSPSYRIDESFIGPGGSVYSSSPNYQESSTAGDIGVGESSSSSYSSVAGFNTTSDPRLSMIVNTPSINFGALSTAATTTATSSFSVLNYTSYGYSVFTVGNPPTMDGHSLAVMTGSAASAGTEQFGINLVDNATPNIGTNPVQIPSGSFSFGSAASGYDTADAFRYGSGEEVAHSLKTSGETDYTISYVLNIATTTPGGAYTSNQTLVVIGTY